MIARRALLGLLLAGAFAPRPRADEDDDDDRPRAVLPLAVALERVERRFRGTVLDADIRPGPKGRLAYEVRFLTPAGNLLQIRLDAVTGRFLEIDGHGFVEAQKP
ncbi:MAG: PepSY domain-containing protein [Alphaproteobacteria bacterium]|nr:PepSY domain-containing protein [Alphaproteobacteria bacterium]